MRCHKIGWCKFNEDFMVLINSQMKLSSSIRLEGSYHIVDGFFPSRFTFLTPLLHLLSRSYIFLSLLQITNDVFLLTSKCGCRSRMYEESSAKCWHFTEKLRRTVAWSTRLSRLVVTRRALWASLENPPLSRRSLYPPPPPRRRT